MKIGFKILLLIFLTSTAGLLAGHGAIVKLANGSLDFLKPETQVNLEYVYDGMMVRGKDKAVRPEEDFVASKVAEYNAQVAGRGDEWRKGWISERNDRYQPRFSELLNQTLTARKSNLQFGFFKDRRYTLILKTTYTELGWKFSDVIKHSFMINAQAIFVETQNRTNVLAVLSITKAPGNGTGSDFNSRIGLAEAYAKAGKELGIIIAKDLK